MLIAHKGNIYTYIHILLRLRMPIEKQPLGAGLVVNCSGIHAQVNYASIATPLFT